MKLTHYYGQYKKGIGKIMESELHITVDYDPKNDFVESIESVTSYNNEKRVHTDLTAIFSENLGDHLDEIVMGIDWRRIYYETKADLKEMYND